MGCAGSKPHHLSSSSHHVHHHTNSPQKGFILFNARTIEYLKANESEIKAKLIERGEHKLLKAATMSGGGGGGTLGHSGNGHSKSLFGTSKKAALLASASNDANKPAAAAESNGSSKPVETKFNEANKFKKSAIESAADYVLTYAINDFDIDNFKSSNHLSMKQIRKDIMKKNSAGGAGISLSKLRDTAPGVSATLPGGEANTSIITATGTLKSSETTFYKLALNTVIDEFGLFIQENFVVINEFNAAKQQNLSSSKSDEENAAKVSTTSGGTSKAPGGGLNAEDEAALKLKEALELARQNFYKGKMSMVCLTKTGGYVVKEVKDNENAGQEVTVVTTATSGPNQVQEPITPIKQTATNTGGGDEPTEPASTITGANSSSPITPENLSNAKTVTVLDPQTNQKSKVAISSKINIEDVDISATFKIIETNQNEFGANANADESTSSTLNTSNTSHAELTATTTTKKSSRTSLRLSKKQESKSSKSKVQAASESSPNSNKASAASAASESMAEFLKVKSGLSQILSDTIESIVAYSTKSTEKADAAEAETEPDNTVAPQLEENLKKAKEIVESLNKLAEREYKLIDEKLVETTISLDYVNREFKNYLALFEAVLKQDDGDDRVKKNAEIARLVEQLDKLISQLPKELFSAKGLPHPSDVNEEPVADQSVTSNAAAQASVSPAPVTAKSPSSSKTTTTTTTTTPQQRKASKKKGGDIINRSGGGGSSKKSSPFKKIIDIKKEIAISILNVGEVLAKTIDYYSMSSSNGNKEEDLKELIKISEQQAAKQALAKQKTDAQIAGGEPTTMLDAGKKVLELPALIAEDSKENASSCVVIEPEKPVEEAKCEQQATDLEAAKNDEVKAPEVQVATAEEVATAPIDGGILELNVLTNEVEVSKQPESKEEDVAGGKVTNGGSQQQQSTTASSLSSPTLSTTSSLSASRTGSSSPVPPISSSSSEQQQLSNVDVECESSDSAANPRRQVTAEATSESTPVITNERVVSESDSDSNEVKTTNGALPSEDLLIGPAANEEKSKMAAKVDIEEEEEATVEKPKHVLDDDGSAQSCGGGLRKEISFLVKEMAKNDQEAQDEKLVLGQSDVDENALMRSIMVKSEESESSSDILSSSNNDDHLDALTKPGLDMNDELLLDQSRELDQSQQEAATTTTTTTVVYRNLTTTDSSNGSSTNTFNGVGGVGKRMSLDEELMYQLEEVDKKVKYMNETCSENEGDDDDDGDDYDPHNNAFSRRRSLGDDEEEELENMEDDERLFHPRTPAKIKSEVRQQRNTELQEEIKQISSVIQDLVQTINVGKNSSGTLSSSTNNVILLNNNNNNDTDMTTSPQQDFYKTPNNSITLNTSTTTSERKRSVNNNNNGSSKRSSVSSTNSSFTGIPVRQQKVLTKQKATTASIEDEQHHQQLETQNANHNSMIDEENVSFKSVLCTPNNSEIFVDLDSSQGSSSPQKLNTSSSSSKKFKSKLPVKK